MRVWDLCVGLGGGTKAFRARGHEVFTVDIDPRFNPDLVADVRELSVKDFPWLPKFILACPPCTEFSRVSMPWFPDTDPDMSVVEACIRLIQEAGPQYWALESVQGARPFIDPILGLPKRCGPHYFWGNFPIFDVKTGKRKQGFPGRHPERRAEIPHEISKALCLAVETMM